MPGGKRRRGGKQDGDETSGARKRGKPSPSPSMLDSQRFTEEVTSLMQKVKPKKDDKYIASFKKQVDQQRQAVNAAINAQLHEQNERLKQRKQAADQLHACVMPSSRQSPTSTQNNAPDYMLQAHQMGLDLGALCKDVVQSYNTIVQVVQDEAKKLPSNNAWADDFHKAQEMIRAGAKKTHDSIAALMGAEDSVEAENLSTALEFDDLTDDQLKAWNELTSAAEMNDGVEDDEEEDDDEETLVNSDITYDAHIASLEKFGNRVLRVTERGH